MSATETDRERYQRDLNWLWGAVHELPAGVLWGANSASREQCAEMLLGLQDFHTACLRLGYDDHADFIEGCRWHFEQYPHYLERRRHFVDYASYTRDRGGPQTVPRPAQRSR